jgi:hypothetical protein
MLYDCPYKYIQTTLKWDQSMSLNAQIIKIGEQIDRVVSTDVGARGVIGVLYAAARAHSELPLCLAAARVILERAKPAEPVVILTGWPDRPGVSTDIAESDGPVGAAALARAVHGATSAVPLVLIEDRQVRPMADVLLAAGLRVQSLEECVRAANYRAPIHAAAVGTLPVDETEAAAMAKQLFAAQPPTAVISIEKGGMNDAGQISTSLGADTTDSHGKGDFFMREAAARGIPTIGVGDGGNELGMGVIRDEIKARLRHGETFAPSHKVDVLVAAAVSNWGAYGIAACLAALTGRPEVFHTADQEEMMLKRAASAGFIDGITGWVEPSADGIPLAAQRSVVELLGTIVRLGLNPNRKQSPLLDP